MDTFFAEYVARLEAQHNTIKMVLEGLTPSALDWQPGPQMNSIGVLVVHVAGAERYWIGDVAVQEPSGRDRAAEFETEGLAAEVLSERLDNSLGYVRTALAGLTTAELGESRRSSRHDGSFTVAWSLLHALDHTAVHTGHIEVTRQVWEAQAK